MGRYGAYPAYKASGVAWLGEIPAHWGTKRLKYVAMVQPSNVDKKTEENELPVFLCNYSDVYNNETITADIDFMSATATPGEISKFLIAEGDVIITKDSESPYDIAVPAYVEQDLENTLCGYHLTQIRGADVSGKYLFRLFQSRRFNAQFVVGSNGVTRFGLPQHIVNDAYISLPPLPEQQAIARFLDHKTAQIDALIARKEALLARLADKRTALISQAVTKGLDPAAPMKNSGIDWLGEIPAHWETRQLKHLVRPDTSITYGIVQAGPNVEDGVPYIRTGDMAGEYLPTEGYLRTSHEIDRQYHRSRVSTGDIVVAIRATVGKCLPVPPYLDGANLTQGTAKVSPGNDLDRNYLLWVMRSGNIQQRFDAVSKGSTFREITLDMLRRLVVPVPPLVEQQAIAEVAQRETEQTYTLASRVTKAIDKLKQYRTALITHAVTGKIDVRGVVIPAVGSEMTFG